MRRRELFFQCFSFFFCVAFFPFDPEKNKFGGGYPAVFGGICRHVCNGHRLFCYGVGNRFTCNYFVSIILSFALIVVYLSHGNKNSSSQSGNCKMSYGILQFADWLLWFCEPQKFRQLFSRRYLYSGPYWRQASLSLSSCSNSSTVVFMCIFSFLSSDPSGTLSIP